jgi:uncharacterized repeat protein (TIGR01451 family)
MKRLGIAVVTSYFLLVAFSTVFAQGSEVVVDTEIFLVNQVTGEDGAVTEDLKPATTARPGQIVEYRLTARNETDTTLPAGTVSITGPVPNGTTFVADSATPTDDRISTEYSADGQNFSDAASPILSGSGDNRTVVDPTAYKAVRWTLLVSLEPGQEETFVYRVTVNPTTN